MGKVDSSLCSFCKVASETIILIYFAAAINQNFCRRRFKTGASQFCPCQIFSPEIVIFGLFDDREYILLQNFIFLLHKKFIYEKGVILQD